MHHYSVFIVFAALAVLSPGPGVALTITNSIRFGLHDTVGGILGLVLGAFLLAFLSATGASLVLAASAVAFTIVKYVGAAYLFYLGVRMWLGSDERSQSAAGTESSRRIRFWEGFSLQLSNPKAIFFFVSIFPQFIDPALSIPGQFSILIGTYCVLIVVIHSLYAASASKARRWLYSPKGYRVVNRVGGTAFILFGLALAGNKL